MNGSLHSLSLKEVEVEMDNLVMASESNTNEDSLQSGQNSEFSANHQFWSEIVEQRQEGRVDYRSTGNAFPLAEAGLFPVSSSVRFWTVDVSTTGALIRTYTPLKCQRMLIELFMPQLSNSVIEVKVVREKDTESQKLNGKVEESFLYGLKFMRVINKEAVVFDQFGKEEELPPQLTTKSESFIESTAAKFVNDVDSNIPFLAAIGLVVVYSSLLFVFQ